MAMTPALKDRRSASTSMATATILGSRAVALALDLAIVSGIQIVLGNVYGVERVTGGNLPQPSIGGYAIYATSTSLDWPWLVAVLLVYFFVLEQLFGATIGKLVTGVRVVSTAGRIPAWRAIAIRNALRVVDGLPVLYLLGGISVLLTASQQRLGDRAAGTLVVPLAEATSRPTHGGRKGAALAALLLVGIGVSLSFDYFGRPALVIQGSYNTHQLFSGESIVGYQLGVPTWGPGTVAYPIRYQRSGGTDCRGELDLRWHGFISGWLQDGAVTHC